MNMLHLGHTLYTGLTEQLMTKVNETNEI